MGTPINKNFKNMFNKITLFLSLILLFSSFLKSQTLIHYNDFEQLMQGGTFGAGASSPTINASNNGILRLSNAAAGYNSLAKQIVNGTSSFYNSLNYNLTLSNHADGTLVIWYFNFRNEVAAQPGGLCGTTTGCSGNRLGLGVILASTSTSAGSTSAGNRYAVVYGDAGDASATNGKLQLVRVADLSNWNTRTIICGTTGTLSSALTGTQDGYYSCKVVYNPQTDAWSLYARYDGTTSFRDPLDPTVAYTQIGSTTVDNTYTLAAHSGMGFGGHFTASNTFVSFDNYYVFNGIGNGSVAGSQITIAGLRNQSSPTVPTLSGITGGANTTNGEQFYFVFGNGLSSNLTVTAPSGLEVGVSPTGSFSSSLILTSTNNQVGGKIYVRPTSTTAVSNTISHSATSATSKTITVDQAAVGLIQTTGVSINLNGASQPLKVNFQNAGTTITGRWNPYQDRRAPPPTANMANSTTTCGFAAATATKSYQSQSFQVSATGSYTFTMRTNGLYDGAGYIVSGAFTPGTCVGSGTWVSGSDNTAGSEPVITTTLTAGITYTLITQFSANQFNSQQIAGVANFSYVWDITPPAGGQLLIPHVTCGNLIADYWNGNHSALGGTQVQDYSLRNTTMNNSTSCLFTTTTNHNYSYNDFQVSADGLYTFTMKNNTGYDGHGYIVRHSTGAGAPPYTPSPFTFGTCPGNGTFIQGDDANGEATITNVQLYAGVTYTLVSSGRATEVANNGTISGAFSWSVTGAGNILTKVDGTLQWYTAASGGSPIEYGGSFNPVGVAGSGLANTSTSGTYTYYVAFSGYPDSRTPVNFIINPSGLPIELVSFTAKCLDMNSILFEWVTASEKNNDFFTIEEATNNVGWGDIYVVNGAGNSTELLNYEYTYRPKLFSLDSVHYYRLKQTDFDGNYKYSGIVSIFCKSNKWVSYFINPTQNSNIIGFIHSPVKAIANIKLYSETGQLVIQRNVSLKDGSNLINIDNLFLSSAMYLIRLTVSDHTFVHKVIVID